MQAQTTTEFLRAVNGSGKPFTLHLDFTDYHETIKGVKSIDAWTYKLEVYTSPTKYVEVKRDDLIRMTAVFKGNKEITWEKPYLWELR